MLFIVLLFLACTNDISNDIFIKSAKNYSFSIVLPSEWKKEKKYNGWMYIKDCADIFCANITFYSVLLEGNDSMESIKHSLTLELESQYKNEFEYITFSPFYSDPNQFSITYSFLSDSTSIIGMLNVIQLDNELLAFEILDNYNSSDEAINKLKEFKNIFEQLKINPTLPRE